jgi:hypothetical protein
MKMNQNLLGNVHGILGGSRYDTAAFQSWTSSRTVDFNAAKAWTVPSHILACIPESVRALLGCSGNGSTLSVIRDIDLLDFFAGQARISKWALIGGLNAVAFDRVYGSHMDLIDVGGFAMAIVLLLRVQLTGLVMLGPQCSTWVWVNRKVSQRSRGNPDGNDAHRLTHEGNVLNKRVALLCQLASLIGVQWVVEQPTSSLFFLTAAMMFVVKRNLARRIHFWMAHYGASTKKGTQLVGTATWLASLSSRETETTKNNGRQTKASAATLGVQTKKKYFGNHKALKASQVYPVKFALIILQRHWPHVFR